MSPLTLVEATPADLDRIMALESAGFAPGNREAREVYARRIEAFPQGSLLAYLDDDCVGCVFLEIWHAHAEPDASHFTLGHDILDRHVPDNGTELYVSSMTVDPAYRGQRLGARLFSGCLHHVAAAFPQLTSAILLVNETWTQARAAYVAAGFAEIARFDGFFSPEGDTVQDGIVMRGRLRTA